MYIIHKIFVHIVFMIVNPLYLEPLMSTAFPSGYT